MEALGEVLFKIAQIIFFCWFGGLVFLALIWPVNDNQSLAPAWVFCAWAKKFLTRL